MDLNDKQINHILDNFTRLCPECSMRMQPLTTRCPGCGVRTPFSKLLPDSYVEHFEIAECRKHKSYFHYCIHPAKDCTLEELKQYCVGCVTELAVKDGVQIVTPDQQDSKFSEMGN